VGSPGPFYCSVMLEKGSPGTTLATEKEGIILKSCKKGLIIERIPYCTVSILTNIFSKSHLARRPEKRIQIFNMQKLKISNSMDFFSGVMYFLAAERGPQPSGNRVYRFLKTKIFCKFFTI
jgi:hypothetical protein